MKAYESSLILDARPRRMEPSDADHFCYLQEYVVPTIKDIVNVVEAPSDALTAARALRKQTSPITGGPVTEILEERPRPQFGEGTELDLLQLDLGIEASPDERPIIRLVRTILLHAVGDGASDIHIEP